MICRHCYKRIVQEDFPPRCVWPNECHDVVDFNKWWDDQVRCTRSGYHHFNIELDRGYYLTYGPHQPHTVTGRYVYPVYVTPLGETVLGDHEAKGFTVYRDQWLTKKEYDAWQGKLTSQND